MKLTSELNHTEPGQLRDWRARWTGVARDWLLPDWAMKRRLWPLLLGPAYLGVLLVLGGGLHWDHLVMAFFPMLDAYNPHTRRFATCFAPYILTGIAYDSMRYYYWWGISGRAHVVEPYRLEKLLFGIRTQDGVVTPNEYFLIHPKIALDLVCGLAYLVFVVESLATSFVLFLVGRLRLLRTFNWSFLVVNLLGFATYFIYPAAPPWYVAHYGFGPARAHVTPLAAGAQRFDALLGTHFFDAMYRGSIDVYGAIPSLHVAYPLLVAWVAFRVGRWRASAVGFYLLMCLAAVYLQHHYFIDVVVGTVYAVAALIAVRWAVSTRYGAFREP